MYMLACTSFSPQDTRELSYLGTFRLCILSIASHRLKPIDIEFMRRLHTKVKLIPIIAKADTLTDEEIAAFKQRVNVFH